ncbi:transporter substrate-binding domain-containing protein [Geomonas nitrogeniifigens]|uniref:histidine kinase n=1 Tax=Geomonas diazotrophica TaxID=2843197 RepID=A0ABX8JJP1_9BACT|nr:transporter substrate-binding domain-containing protein [Geomonas nitrogeniifigens]QWV97346.1 transporter substrate-binding domain-containing protein [Geomonas nitrogeniifigens]QXE86504.1 transporter substrate-binding domain-containing protein [Geomonas nitrogeniifigens]
MLTRIILLLLTLILPASGFAAQSTAPASASRLIVVGGNSNYPPYQFLDKYGQPAGYIVDLTKAIASVMGMQVEIRLGDFGAILKQLDSGEVDVLEGLSFSETRAREFDFSTPHSIIVQAIFARKGTPKVKSLDELKGKKVLVHRGGGMHNYLKEMGWERDLVLTDSPRETLEQLARGDCDYAVLALLPGMYIIREEKLTDVVPVASNVAPQRYYCYAVKKGNAELLAQFNEGLSILKKTGQFDEIYNKWIGVLEPQKTSWLLIAKYAALVVIPLSLILAATVLWSYSLRRQVAQRTESLSNALAELQRNQQQLVQADKMAALGILVSGVAHEINNPTGIILMNMPTLKKIFRDAERILDRYQEEEGDFSLGGIRYQRVRQEVPLILDEIQDGAHRIKKTVDDLKNFARKDDEARKEPLDFNEVVRTAVRLVDVATRKYTSNFSVSYGAGLPPVHGNAQRLEQVVVNLIMNAGQALPDPSRGIEVATSHDAGAGRVVLKVRDQGTGIAPEHLQHLTDPFFTTKRESGGTGLGLSISANIIKDHGGDLGFESSPGEGTTVTLSLPAAVAGSKNGQ